MYSCCTGHTAIVCISCQIGILSQILSGAIVVIKNPSQTHRKPFNHPPTEPLIAKKFTDSQHLTIGSYTLYCRNRTAPLTTQITVTVYWPYIQIYLIYINITENLILCLVITCEYSEKLISREKNPHLYSICIWVFVNISVYVLCLYLLYPQTKVGDILDSGPSRRRRRRRRRRNFLVDAITQKQINIFFSNLVHMLRVPKGRSLF